jgi:transposase
VVWETFRATYVLAVASPEWLTEQMHEGWEERDEHGIEGERLPDGTNAHEAYAFVIGKDGKSVLNASDSASAPVWLRDIPAVHTVCRASRPAVFWEEGELRWRETTTIPVAGDCIKAPCDPKAQKAKKRDIGRVGGRTSISLQAVMMIFPT